ncbi:MAG TPA: GNAT family N-acetyltransferase [Desulfitobacteriaceae bacterium]|jgi:N-acetylglutamate synthase-like GNAT family acetyltransferase|nr:GNAT family N-acetyltransferase [Desulfitobacteriaceae bacterium]
MIRKCESGDEKVIYEIVNDAAQAYKGVIPQDCWQEPYMPFEELLHELDEGVEFWGYEKDGTLLGVMGLQQMNDVSLIRHAYVRTANRNSGIGGKLITYLRTLTNKPLLIGTWAAADWAIRFYEKYGFKAVSNEEKNKLLRKYWKISDRQIETSVVLAEG